MVKPIRVDNTKFYLTYLKKFVVNRLHFTVEIKTECVASFYHIIISHSQVVKLMRQEYHSLVIYVSKHQKQIVNL